MQAQEGPACNPSSKVACGNLFPLGEFQFLPLCYEVNITCSAYLTRVLGRSNERMSVTMFPNGDVSSRGNMTVSSLGMFLVLGLLVSLSCNIPDTLQGSCSVF